MRNNSEIARKNILHKLRELSEVFEGYQKKSSTNLNKKFTKDDKLKNLKRNMESSKAEVYYCSEDNYCEILSSITKSKKIKKLLYGKETNLGQKLLDVSKKKHLKLPELVDYKNPIDDSKDFLFEIDSAITSTIGGIADTGSLILWPSHDEPRLMSLVPPIHIAVLRASKIYNTFWEAMTTEGWDSKMPTNVLLISGPSKTADIEQTLVHGIHGCRELIVLLIK